MPFLNAPAQFEKPWKWFCDTHGRELDGLTERIFLVKDTYRNWENFRDTVLEPVEAAILSDPKTPAHFRGCADSSYPITVRHFDKPKTVTTGIYPVASWAGERLPETYTVIFLPSHTMGLPPSAVLFHEIGEALHFQQRQGKSLNHEREIFADSFSALLSEHYGTSNAQQVAAFRAASLSAQFRRKVQHHPDQIPSIAYPEGTPILLHAANTLLTAHRVIGTRALNSLVGPDTPYAGKELIAHFTSAALTQENYLPAGNTITAIVDTSRKLAKKYALSAIEQAHLTLELQGQRHDMPMETRLRLSPHIRAYNSCKFKSGY